MVISLGKRSRATATMFLQTAAECKRIVASRRPLSGVEVGVELVVGV
jgi:hypothetical protein